MEGMISLFGSGLCTPGAAAPSHAAYGSGRRMPGASDVKFSSCTLCAMPEYLGAALAACVGTFGGWRCPPPCRKVVAAVNRMVRCFASLPQLCAACPAEQKS